MKIQNLRIIDKGSVKASFEIYIEQWGLHILATLMDKNGSKWLSMPARPFEKDGQKKYQWLTWFDKDTHKRFEEKVIMMIDAGQFDKAPEQNLPTQKEDSVHQNSKGALNTPVFDDDIPF
jgi:hypothetical protein